MPWTRLRMAWNDLINKSCYTPFSLFPLAFSFCLTKRAMSYDDTSEVEGKHFPVNPELLPPMPKFCSHDLSIYDYAGVLD